MEDSATLRSDTSAISGLREAAVLCRCLFFRCLPETNALNLGVWGRAPRTYGSYLLKGYIPVFVYS